MASPADDQAIVSSAEYGPNPIFGQEPANDDNDSSVDNNEAIDDYTPFDESNQNQQTVPQETANNDNTPAQPYTQTYDGQPPPNTQHEQDNGQPPPTSHNIDENAAGYYYDKDPKDVVAQMREDNPDLAIDDDDDDPDYGSASQVKTVTDDDTKAVPIPQGLFGIFFIRTIYIAASLFVFSICVMPLWFSDTTATDFGAAYGLSGFACVIMMLTSLTAIALAVVVKLGIPIPLIHFIILGVMVSYIVAGVFYIIGGIAVAAVWNGSDICPAGVCSEIAGVFFGEAVFVGGHCCVAGLDLWKQWLNNKKWRTIVYCSALALAALILFFSYAIIHETEAAVGRENPALALCGAGYFFVGTGVVVYVVFEMIPMIKEKIKEKLGMRQNIVALIMAGLFVLFVLIVFFGYIAIAANDGTLFVFFGLIAFYQVMDQAEDVDDTEEFMDVFDLPGEILAYARPYFVGVGLFVLFMSIIIILDMKFGEFLLGGKEGLEEEENKGQPAINFDDDDDISDSPNENDNIMGVDRDQNENMNNNGQNNDNM